MAEVISQRTRNLVAIGLTLAGLMLMMLSCTKNSPAPEPSEIVVTVPVVETRIIEVTREVERTVVVTATPVPTPAYASPNNAAPGTLVYPLPSDPLTLDPQEAYDTVSLLVTGQLHEGLYSLRGNGLTVPAAAGNLAASSDGTTYTVTLRTGLTWSDGGPLTAQHYVNGVCRFLDPTIGNPLYYLLTEVAPLQGAAAYAGGDVADCATVGITAVDDLNLRITLDRPAAFLPKLLATSIFWPALSASSQSTVEAASANPATNGPYLLAEQVSGDHITLTKNPNYWNAAEVTIDRIELPVVPDLARQLALYEAGDLHVAEFPAEATERIQADPAFSEELHVLVQPGTSYLGLNLQAAPTNDINVRRAIASAIDRQALIELVLKQPWHVPAQGLFPPDTPGYGSSGGYPFDLDAARHYLTEAGYGPENPIPPVELWYNREGNNKLIFEAVGAMLEQAGIPVRLVSSQWDIYLSALGACNKPIAAEAVKTPGECGYNLYRMGWVMDYADASSLLRVFSPKSSLQYTGWASEDFDRLLAEALMEPGEAMRTELYRQSERILLTDEVAVIPLQHYDRTVLVKAGIVFDYPPFGPPNLQYWKLRQ